MKKLLGKVAELVAFYGAIPGGFILTLGSPSLIYKQAILVSYALASVASIAHGTKTKQFNMAWANVLWLGMELYGLLGPSLFKL